MAPTLSKVGFLLLGGTTLFQAWAVYRITALQWPGLRVAVALGLGLFWLGGMAVFLWCTVRRRLRLAFGIAFCYGMGILLAGTQLLPGVPAEVGKTEWKDPRGLLTPDAKYLLHNHSVVLKVLTQEEYDAYCLGAAVYFSVAGVMIGAIACLKPLDRQGELFRSKARKVPAADEVILGTVPCTACGASVPVHLDGCLPPWCSTCGADLGRSAADPP